MIDAKDLQKANLPDHICLLCGYQVRHEQNSLIKLGLHQDS